MKVAIQGASGFVGSRLMEWIHLRELAEVVPIIRSFSSLARIARFQLDWRLADALDEEALTKAFEGCEIVFHTIVGPPATILQTPEATVRAAERAGVKRVVYLSTGLAYGFNPDRRTTDESRVKVDQPWDYNRAKAEAEERIAVLRQKSNVEVAVLIPTIVYGPRSSSFTTAIAIDLLRKSAYLVDQGSGICNAIYVDNLVNAMWLAAVVPEARNQDFFVSDGELVTWADLYGSVADAVGVSLEDVSLISRDEALTIIKRKGSWKARQARRVKTGPARQLFETIPGPVKDRVRRTLRAWRETGQDSSLAQTFEHLDGEQLAVQLNDIQLPIEKAKRVLGYNPIPFPEATRRTATWLRSNGYTATPSKQYFD